MQNNDVSIFCTGGGIVESVSDDDRSKTSSWTSSVWLWVVELEVPLLKEAMILWGCEMYNLCPETEHTNIRANFE
jgi:hypothetical protein